MVLTGYGINDNRLRAWEKLDWMVFHSDWKHLHHLLQYTNFLDLSDKESVTVIPLYTLRKKGETKTVSVLTRLLCSLVP